MKLQELAAISPTKQAAKVFESYFGETVPFEQLNRTQARHMLNRVRSLIAEHRAQPSFHTSEQNPSYMKLIVLEQGLAAKINETITPGGGAPANEQPGAAGAPMQTPQQVQGAMTLQKQQRDRQIQDAIKVKQKELQDLQKQLTMPMAESRRSISESEVQQAQVVLASQDMVDQVQKMIEQVTSMQFKDLPALVDQVKNQMGPDQAMQFNQDVTTALTGLTQNLQGSKTQLEGALGVVTGQAPVVPGTPVGGEELPVELPAGEETDEFPLEPEDDEESPKSRTADLGRARR